MTESHFLLCFRAPYGPPHEGVQKLSRGEVYNIRNSMGSFGFWPDCYRESTGIGPPAGRGRRERPP